MTIKELLKKYFSEESLTEEAKTEIETMFQAAISEATEKKLQEKTAEVEKNYADEAKSFKSKLIEDLSNYMEEAFKEWFEENKPAMIAEDTVTMAETTVKALRGALEENFVKINEEEVDVVADLKEQVEKLKTQLDEQGNKSIKLEKDLTEYRKAIAFKKITEGMASTDAEKLLSLVEDIEASSIESFVEKVKIIKDKYMSEDLDEDTKKVKDKDLENLDEDLINNDVDPTDKYVPRAFV